MVLFGGSFDPPHRAHVRLSVLARDAVMPADAWLIFVPAARNPLKQTGPIASAADRIEMLRIATRGLERTSIWPDEIERAEGTGEPSYWVETLRRARRAVDEEAELRFLIGADAAVTFHRWREARAILELADPIVLPRPPIETAEALHGALDETGAWDASEIDRWRRALAPVPAMPLSATGFREEGAREALDPPVLEYISHRKLYSNNLKN